jgi:CheY-like chemotaxis protein
MVILSGTGAGMAGRRYLPRASSIAGGGTSASNESGHTPPPDPISILLVEDDSRVRDTVSKMLVLLGYQVVTAGSGLEALVILTTNEHFHLMIADVVLRGGSNGIELAAKARRLRSRLKVLLISGYSREMLVRHYALDAEIEFLAKPFARRDLAHKVRSLLHADLE